MRQVVFLIEAISASFVLWLGLFILTRDLPFPRHSYWQRPAFLAGASTILLAFYLLGVAMQMVSTIPSEFIVWQKSTWWVAPLAVFLFFRAVILLSSAQTRWSIGVLKARRLWLGLALYASLLALGIILGSFMRDQEIQPENSPFEHFFVPVRLPHFYAYNLYLMILLLAIVVLLLRQFWQAYRQGAQAYHQFEWLGYGSILLILGALVSAVLHPLTHGMIPQQLGDLFLTLGAAAVSFGVGRYNALAHDRMIEQDFWHSLLSVTLTVIFYEFTFHAVCWALHYPRPFVATPLLAFLAVITQTPLGLGEALSDRLLLPTWVASYRLRLGEFRHNVLTVDSPQALLETSLTQFQEIVAEAKQEELDAVIQQEIDFLFQYTRLQDDELLANSQLQRLQIVQRENQAIGRQEGTPPNALNAKQRAQGLRTLLCHLLTEQQATALQMAASQVLSAQQIESLLLQKKYIEKLSRVEVERFFQQTHNIIISGGAYSRHLANARKTLAANLCKQERLLRRGANSTE